MKPLLLSNFIRNVLPYEDMWYKMQIPFRITFIWNIFRCDEFLNK